MSNDEYRELTNKMRELLESEDTLPLARAIRIALNNDLSNKILEVSNTIERKKIYFSTYFIVGNSKISSIFQNL